VLLPYGIIEQKDGISLKHVIIGNGAAASTAAWKLREMDAGAGITVISRENVPAYMKIMLPDYTGGKISREKLFIRDINSYRSDNIDLQLNTVITGVDTRKHEIYPSSGSPIQYDDLLIAAGGVPFVPDIAGLKETEYYIINSLEDADIIKNAASPGKTALILGGGLTGIEMAFALERLGMNVVIAEKMDRILPVQLDDRCRAVFITWLEAGRIRLMTGKSAHGISRLSQRRSMSFSDGSEILYDMLLVTIGTRPDISIVEGSGIKCGRGILVDDRMKTSAESVYAAGDIADGLRKTAAGYVTSYIWPAAISQGRCAAINMGGSTDILSPESLLQNSINLRDIPFCSMGMINPPSPDYSSYYSLDSEKRIYKKIVVKDGILSGMIFIGDVESANRIASLIRKGTELSSDIRSELHSEGFIF